MSQPRISNIRSFADVNYEVDWIHRLITNLQNKTSSTTVVTSLTGDNYRSGWQSLAAGSNTVTFSSPFTGANYHLIIEIYNADGVMMPQPTISGNITQLSSGFMVIVGEPSIIKYTAVLYTT